MDSEFDFVASGLLLARDLVISGLEALVLRLLIVLVGPLLMFQKLENCFLQLDWRAVKYERPVKNLLSVDQNLKKNATLCECQLYCRISHCGYFCRNGGDDD